MIAAGGRPWRISGNESFAVSATTVKSHSTASPMPNPAASPWTSATEIKGLVITARLSAISRATSARITGSSRPAGAARGRDTPPPLAAEAEHLALGADPEHPRARLVVLAAERVEHRVEHRARDLVARRIADRHHQHVAAVLDANARRRALAGRARGPTHRPAVYASRGAQCKTAYRDGSRFRPASTPQRSGPTMMACG